MLSSKRRLVSFYNTWALTLKQKQNPVTLSYPRVTNNTSAKLNVLFQRKMLLHHISMVAETQTARKINNNNKIFPFTVKKPSDLHSWFEHESWVERRSF